ncbi:MAG: sodium:solute symporter [Planctomycetota bacterium]
MNMGMLDWIIVISLFIALTAMARFTKRYTRSVADFLAANRCAGRYLICIAEGMAALGAVAVIGQMQIYYNVGFASQWWGFFSYPVLLLMSLTGWVIYRFRETRALTLAQFFEIRYSRKFRVFSGMLAFGAGIINYGIFPAIGANFFMQYCGLPETIGPVPIFPMLVAVLLAVSVYFTLSGGQITVIVTDFLQGMFCNIVFVAILVVLLFKFRMSDIFETLLAAPPGKSMVNPFDLEGNVGYTVWFFVIHLATRLYNSRGWQSEQAYNCAALNPHEAKMANVISNFRWWAFWGIILFLPLCAYTLMHNPKYAEQAGHVQMLLGRISNEEVRNQMITPVAMTTFLPKGLLGAFAAAIFAAFISTHNTQLHSWGCIFVQDVLAPLRKKPLSPEEHLRWLRLSILGVTLFVFLWSCFFRQTQRMQLFFMITGAIFLGGAGSVIIGGLYWKRGTTAAAWLAMIVGSGMATSAVVVDQVWKSLYDKNFPIDFKWMTAISMGSAILSYAAVSLLGKRVVFNMNRMLHRGKYALKEEHAEGVDVEAISRWSFKKFFGYTDDFTRGDKIIYACAIFQSMLFFTVSVVTVSIAVFHGLSNKGWGRCTYYLLLFSILTGFLCAVWLSIGGLRDTGRFFQKLKTVQRNDLDDGRVIEHHNLGEEFGERN